MAALERIWTNVRAVTTAVRPLLPRPTPSRTVRDLFNVRLRFGTAGNSGPCSSAIHRPSVDRGGAAGAGDERSNPLSQVVQYHIDRQTGARLGGDAVSRTSPSVSTWMEPMPGNFRTCSRTGISVEPLRTNSHPRPGLGSAAIRTGQAPRRRYDPFVQTIRACLRHAGGLRIDHDMGLFRLFGFRWPPSRKTAHTKPSGRSVVRSLRSKVSAPRHYRREDLEPLKTKRASSWPRSDTLLSSSLSRRHRHRTFTGNARWLPSPHTTCAIAGRWSGSDLKAQQRLGLSERNGNRRHQIASPAPSPLGGQSFRRRRSSRGCTRR